MNRDALQYALGMVGLDPPIEERNEILAVYLELKVVDEVRDGNAHLRDAG